MRNRYPGPCRTCGGEVAAEAGVVIKEDGRWRTYCSDHEPRPAPPPRGDHLGWHTVGLAGYDCETSSNDPREAFLVSAALVDSAGGARTWLVDPGDREIPADAVAIHGITTERARAEGVPAEDALEEIAGALVDHLLADRGLVIFNAPFDLGVLDNELRRRDMKSLTDRLGTAPRPIIDPLVIDRGIDPYRRGPRNLGAMCAYYGVDLTDAHTAVADAAACLALAQEIAARHPDLAGLALPALHERQVEWAAGYARSRQEWLDRRRPGHGRVIDGTWPAAVAV
ncbi:exonuclease domain-containing protein [Marinitenerispora sediminis]|uniref:DNA polymerase III subunit epsilon n=1 Tax=Marinitenerispora sediminis TaxID=1931232 RepID=A0A368T9J0_9ACTN|nr:exonuclease domain-containing protein [Marinitenerispora sediminis]RCV55170.1 DNA polymerase III subunit epsilon [Marinitenerispora sediminis]RCV61256.1 DNA polymerase III subunit epsilon [Marinitenerispora sediminis]RCV61527.1 DNA polymerase III subunit epsilon [Marinitenerispora sediminis]